MNKEKNKAKNHSAPKNDFRKIVKNSIIRRELMLKKLSYKKRPSIFPLPNINLNKFNSFKLNNSIHQKNNVENQNRATLKNLEKMKNITKIFLNSKKDKVNQYLEKCKNELEERNRETSILCSYLNDSNKFKIIKNKKKIDSNNLNILLSPSLEKQYLDNIPENPYLRCISSVGKITNYSNGFNSLLGEISQINYIDPLIMDKFNLYYKKGLLKDFSSPNIFTKYQI